MQTVTSRTSGSVTSVTSCHMCISATCERKRAMRCSGTHILDLASSNASTRTRHIPSHQRTRAFDGKRPNDHAMTLVPLARDRLTDRGTDRQTARDCAHPDAPDPGPRQEAQCPQFSQVICIRRQDSRHTTTLPRARQCPNLRTCSPRPARTSTADVFLGACLCT